MTEMKYNKLVRDKIPSIMESQGLKPETLILDQPHYTYFLEAKLDEETAEFHKEKNLEELADILEVVYALAENLGSSKEELLGTYEKKHRERGGFRDRVFLISNEG